MIYLTFMHCTCKFEKYKPYCLSEDCDHTYPNKKHKQTSAHEKMTDALFKVGRPNTSCARTCYVGG